MAMRGLSWSLETKLWLTRVWCDEGAWAAITRRADVTTSFGKLQVLDQDARQRYGFIGSQDWSRGTTRMPCYVDAGGDPADARTRVR
uniref:Putative secreted protein n=1 Tax=Ixodes ricinus TaxID=34613 RepID=A0A6B0U8X0_IXORI